MTRCVEGHKMRAGRTHGISDAVREAHELDIVAGTLPVRVQREDQPQRRGLRIRMVV